MRYPLLSEKAVGLIEKTNTITFIVDVKANKQQIKDEVEKLYGVKVAKVNTEIGFDGRKRAYVRLKPEFKATDLATRLKII